jgi:hypothetical protein
MNEHQRYDPAIVAQVFPERPGPFFLLCYSKRQMFPRTFTIASAPICFTTSEIWNGANAFSKSHRIIGCRGIWAMDFRNTNESAIAYSIASRISALMLPTIMTA